MSVIAHGPIFYLYGDDMEDYILAFDEINALTAYSYQSLLEDGKDASAVVDDVLSILISAYTLGTKDAGNMLNHTIPVDVDSMYEVIFLVIEGETFEDRVMNHIRDNDLRGLQVLVESEFHRVYNASIETGAKWYESDTKTSVTKSWITVGDARVRETHSYLEGASVGLDEHFYTFDGDHAAYPGGFTKASNNVNCRCVIKVQSGT